MFEKQNISNNKEEMYSLIIKQLNYLLEDVNDNIANLSNTSALLNVYLENINWVGFYLYKNSELVLGPFQGMPACTKIQIGNGVCGTAAKTLSTMVVDDVGAFPGHIACDGASKSEIVVPIIIEDKLFGLLDIDSPILSRFDEDDKLYLENVINTIISYISID
ncbi:GAF domain-containing protein [Mycoplasmatota bacterium]|nr:GAF domain-containing protein [Mycoplasmatota bacterium]